MGTLLDRSVTEAGEVFVYAYTRWEFSLTGLGDLTARTALYFTAKQYPDDDTDAEAVLQVEETIGLVAIDKVAVAAADQVNGSLTVDGVTNGDITITVEEDMTGIGRVVSDWDVKMITATGAQLMGTGSLSVITARTRAIT